jgi:hypothetical protein
LSSSVTLNSSAKRRRNSSKGSISDSAAAMVIGVSHGCRLFRPYCPGRRRTQPWSRRPARETPKAPTGSMERQVTQTFIVKLQPSKTGSSLFSLEWLPGHPESSGARLSLPTSHLAHCRLSATYRDPTWLPQEPSFWPYIGRTLHHTVPRASPEPRRSTFIPGLEVLRRGSGEAPGRLAGRSGAGLELERARGSAV